MKKCFITGLAALLPLAFTFWFIHLIVGLFTKPFTDGLRLIWGNSMPGAKGLSQILVVVFLFLAALLIGFVTRRFFFSQILYLADKFLHHIPFVNKIYKTSKELIHSLFGENKTPFRQVVLAPFPYPGAYCVGLVTADFFQGHDLVSVFIPTVPNPATGYIVILPRSELISIDISTEEAIKYVLSCGVIQPGAPA